MIRIPSSWAVLPSIRGVPHIGTDESRTPTQWHPERGGPIYITMHSRLSLSSPFSRWITRSPVVITSPTPLPFIPCNQFKISFYLRVR
jgi:hypothetical protein